MLVLSRKRGEKIHITLEPGREIVLTVVKTGWNEVRLGIEAPQDIAILRGELFEREVELD